MIVTYISTTVHSPKPQSQEVGIFTVNLRMLFSLACVHASLSECIEKSCIQHDHPRTFVIVI